MDLKVWTTNEYGGGGVSSEYGGGGGRGANYITVYITG